MNSTQVSRNVVPNSTIAACAACHQDAILVAQRDRHAVYLRLQDVGLALRADQLGNTLIKLHQLVARVGVRQAHHGHGMLNVAELIERRAAHTKSRRIGRGQIRMSGFKLLKPVIQGVILAVGDLGAGIDVVELVVTIQLDPKLLNLFACVALAHCEAPAAMTT